MSLKVLQAVVLDPSRAEVARLYVAGSDLLGLLNFRPQGGLGTGQSQASPITGMRDVAGWQQAVNTLQGPPEQWVRFGPVHVKKTADSYYMNAEGIETQGVKERGGPSYNELTGLLAKLGLSDAKIAAGVRKLLTGDTEGALPELACLTAAMFLAEPKRNPRSFPINLMLLDFVENGVKYGKAGNKDFSWERILWRTGFGPRRDKVSKTYDFKSGGVLARQTLAGHERGGKLPMSHTGAVDQSQQALPPHPPENHAIHLPNAEMDKECTIVVRWLVNVLNKGSSSFTMNVSKLGEGTSLAERLKAGATTPVTYQAVFSGLAAVPAAQFAYVNLDRPLPGSYAEAIAKKIQGALTFRCNNLVIARQ